MATRPKFAKMANYSRECVEASHIFLKEKNGKKWLANVGRMYRVRGKWLANVGRMYRVRAKQGGQCRRKQDRSIYIQKKIFLCIKRSSLHSLNSPNSLNSLNSCKSCQTCLSRMYRVRGKWLANVGRMYQVRENGWRMSGECIESGQFSKMAILASTRIRQNWQIFGEYSNSTNSPASGHCLLKSSLRRSPTIKIRIFLS